MRYIIIRLPPSLPLEIILQNGIFERAAYVYFITNYSGQSKDSKIYFKYFKKTHI